MSVIDITIVILFLIATLWVGFKKGKHVRSFKDFSVGTKNYSLPVLVSTTAATWLGGGDSVGLASEIFRYGFPVFFFYSFQMIMDLFMAFIVAPRMKGHNTGISLGDMIEPHYGKVGRIIISLVAVLKTFGNVGIQVSAIGAVMEVFLSIPQTYGAIIGMGIIILYTSFGGIRAVVFTDVLQFAFLVVSIPLVANLLLSHFGGFISFWEMLPATHTSLSQTAAPSKFLIAIALSQLTPLNPLLIHRFFLNKDVQLMKRSLAITAAIEVPFFFFVTIIGLSAFLLYPDITPNSAFVHMIITTIPVGVKGLAAAGLIAIIMSSADSAVNLNSILFMNDIVRPLSKNRFSEDSLVKATKYFNFFSGVASVVVALMFTSILDLMLYFMAFWTPIALVPILGIVFKAKASPKTFLYGAFSGVVGLILWGQLEGELASLIPAFAIGPIANAIVFIGRYHLVDKKNAKHSKKPSRLTREFTPLK